MVHPAWTLRVSWYQRCTRFKGSHPVQEGQKRELTHFMGVDCRLQFRSCWAMRSASHATCW